MNKFIARSLGILMIGGASVAMAQPPLPKIAVTPAAAPALPMLTKSAIKQSLNLTFAYKKPVRVSALMTKQERKWYQRAMQSARTLEARRQIRELTYARLMQRATERGMLVVFPNSKAYATHGEVAPQLREVVREPVAPRTVAKPAAQVAKPVITHTALKPAAVPHPTAAPMRQPPRH